MLCLHAALAAALAAVATAAVVSIALLFFFGVLSFNLSLQRLPATTSCGLVLASVCLVAVGSRESREA